MTAIKIVVLALLLFCAYAPLLAVEPARAESRCTQQAPCMVWVGRRG